jgi:Peptidase A4 family
VHLPKRSAFMALAVMVVAATAVAGAAAPASAAAAPAAKPGPAASSHGPHTAPNHIASRAKAPDASPLTTPAPLTSYNWSGYLDVGTTDNEYTEVSSNWVNPGVVCNSTGAVAIWAGLDGGQVGAATVEQTGVDISCATGTAQFTAWWETYPAAQVDYSVPVGAGDSMSASVTYISGVYYMALTDHTRGWSEDTPWTATYANSSAEVIVEAPTVNGSIVNLPDFSPVVFSGSTINNAGFTSPVDGVGGTQVEYLINSAKTPIAEPTAYNGSSGFTVTYGGGPGGGVAGNFVASSDLLDSFTVTGPAPIGVPVRAFTSPSIAELSTGGYESAYQSPGGVLELVGSAGNINTGLGMASGTSPSIAASPEGGYMVAFEANTGVLWLYGTEGTYDLGLGMMAGTSPAIAGLAGGGYEETFQANTGILYVYGNAESAETYLGMQAGTSPSIAASSSGSFEVAFHATGGTLWVFTPTTAGINVGLAMAGGTSPAVAPMAGGGYQLAIQTSSGTLTLYGDYDLATGIGMAPGTSPALAGIPSGGYEVGYEALSTDLLSFFGTEGNITTFVQQEAATTPSIDG